MKRCLYTVLMVLLVVGLCSSRSSNPISPDGTYKGKRLCGKVAVFNQEDGRRADFRVKVTSRTRADLRVRIKEWPWGVGDWQIVSPHEYYNFSVTFVDGSGPREDFSIHICNRITQ